MIVEDDPKKATAACRISNTIEEDKINTKYTNFVDPTGDGVPDFNFIYDLANYDFISGVVKVKGTGLNVTNLNKDNVVYFQKNSNSIAPPNASILAKSPNRNKPSWSNCTQIRTLMSYGGCVLSNCVGYVVSRTNEIWKIAVDSGYIEKKGNVWVIKHEGREIQGSINIPKTNGKYGDTVVPNKNACLMWSAWPAKIPGSNPLTDIKPGWYKSTGISSSNGGLIGMDPDVGPTPGCIISWGDYNGNTLNTSIAGHVGFVEKVINPGQPDEAIIYSESGYDGWHIGNDKIVQIKTLQKYGVSKSYPYALSTKRRCVGFLASPITQLISSVYFNSNGLFGSIPININQIELELRGILNENGEPNPPAWERKNPQKGDPVIVKSIGYKDPNKRDKPVNVIKTPGRVTMIIPDAQFPYGVSIDNSFIPTAFYNRNGLIFKG